MSSDGKKSEGSTKEEVVKVKRVEKTEDEWKKALSDKEYEVLRNKGTERAFSGEYDHSFDKGTYVCKACGNPLYSWQSKFDSGCGWPAFDKCIPGALKTHEDTSHGMKRVEIMCGACDGHLGHVFSGEHLTDTNERHCVNSVSIKLVKEKAT